MKKILFLLTVLFNIAQASPTISPELKHILTESKLIVPSMSAEETLVLMKNKNVILIDVRETEEWAKGVIKTPQLIKIQRGWLEIKYPKLILKQYSKNDTFIVYCGIEPRSILAAHRLKDLGFSNVAYLKGGIKNWKKQNYPLVTSK